MPFNHIGTPDGTKFTHKSSGKAYVCHSFRSYNKDTLTLELSKEGSTDHLAAASMEYSRYDFLSKFIWKPTALKYPKGACGVITISIDTSDRGNYLGALLMLLLTVEVRANRGTHLYLIDPRTEALGFYLQFGFHPDPSAVGKCHPMTTNSPTGDLSKAIPVFHAKFEMTRKYRLWRGQVDLVQSLLRKKVTPVFQFN